jgi:TolB-like protein/DNA-binding winged helix-turn-helix (wHTH) protein/tetratricopeptide (TPR) repeat protein
MLNRGGVDGKLAESAQSCDGVVNGYRFDRFEVDVRTGELCRDGTRLQLQDKPFQLLIALLERPGELLTNEELQRRLWPADTFVDFALGLKVAVKKLRNALGDHARAPRYVENLPRRGYRFIVEVEAVNHTVTRLTAGGNDAQALEPAQLTVNNSERNAGVGEAQGHSTATPARSWQWRVIAVAAAVVLIAAVTTVVVERLRPTQPAAAQPVSLAVLPFTVIGNDRQSEYLSLGMADALILRLGRLKRFAVRPTSAVRGFSGSKPDAVAAGRRLGVENILDGDFQRFADRIRVTVQLVRVADGFALWTEQFDEKFTDIFGFQDSIAARVAGALNQPLSGDQIHSMAHRSTVNPDAYEAFLKGRFFWNKRTEDGHTRAIEHFQRAIQLDPNFAPAYAGLADAYALLGSMANKTIPRSQAMPAAREAATRALQLDDSLAEAHTSLAFVHMHYDWNWPAAEREYRRALELNPSYATAHQWYGFYLVAQGRREDAIASVERAHALDPLSLIISTDLAELLVFNGEYERAVRQCRKTLEMDPNFGLAHRILGHAYSRLGRHREAIKAMERAREFAGSTMWALPDLAYIYAVAGKQLKSRALLEEALKLSDERQNTNWNLAALYASIGDADRTFQWLEKALAARDGSLIVMKVEPYFQPFASDPRYQKIAATVGLPQ